MGKVEFLYLTEEEMIQAGVLDAKQCVDTINEAFQLVGQGDYLMGGPSENDHGVMINFPAEKRFPNMPVKGPDRRFMALVAYLGGRFNVCGEKWYGSNIENVPKGLPRSIHTVMLNKTETGEPITMMAGNLISAMRTGAVPGVAARYLAHQDASVLGLVGAGVINKATLKCLHAAIPNLTEVKVYDLFSEKSAAFSQVMGEELGVNVHPVDSLEACIKGSDVNHLASAGKVAPFIETQWLKEGSLLESSAFMEFNQDLLLNNLIVMDQIKMHECWYEKDKEMNLPTFEVIRLIQEGKLKREEVLNLGEIALGRHKGLYNNGRTTIFMAEGMPVWDVAWAYQVYQNALERGIGQKLTLWEEPHWF